MQSDRERDEGSVADYVRRVNDDTRRFVQELLAENERLVGQLSRSPAQPREASYRAQDELERQSREHSRLQDLVANVETENRRFSAQYIELEQQNFNLMNLYVAAYRLHGTLDPNEVLETIREIVANLIGSEEMAVFSLEPGGRELRLLSSAGIDEARYRRIPLDAGTIGWVARTGRTYVAADDGSETAPPPERELTACFPLKVEEKVTGVIAIFRLLSQKQGLEAVDRELLNLLGTQAAMAIYCTRLHAGQRVSTGTQA